MQSLFQKLGISKEKQIVIVCGTGNKGGNGLAATRHLYNNGYRNIKVVLVATDIKEAPQQHLTLLKHMDIPITLGEDGVQKITKAEVCIDALIGYNLNGAPRGLSKLFVDAMNASSAGVFSFDIPTGLDATTGECYESCIRADYTLTLALPKKGFLSPEGKEKSGDIYVADLGIPAYLYNEIEEGSRPQFEMGLYKV